MLRQSIVAIALCCLSAISAFAQVQGGGMGEGQPGAKQGNQGTGSGGQGGGGHHHGPPPEAIDACNGKASGAACSFIGRQNKQLTGTCFSPPPRDAGQSQGTPAASNSAGQDKRPMACRPNRGGPGK
ncbi:MAG: hypothetical protein IPP91_17115 [Betaproteobacteria bacterium]|nr:hypothetical protein [Betaproteobacteria bacterium]